jgi:hypothetical protein
MTNHVHLLATPNKRGIAAQDDVVEATGNIEAEFPGHWAGTVQGRALCN